MPYTWDGAVGSVDMCPTANFCPHLEKDVWLGLYANSFVYYFMKTIFSTPSEERHGVQLLHKILTLRLKTVTLRHKMVPLQHTIVTPNSLVANIGTPVVIYQLKITIVPGLVVGHWPFLVL
jgi:hypothetical protein